VRREKAKMRYLRDGRHLPVVKHADEVKVQVTFRQ
jgi:hypothetical protein